ncbi:phosphate/phosphite/phosphonate ABC transporter substrate-binding protein [Candidatus Deferrimicrobium sp.]|uniref:phosphate/phosphite/phosphonate ABC transporter substrate-binding protein n=1 Tax=Candidatus Deferrimicrobium sp. TaxID=3060586 RepID=UPI00271DFE6D|nr:phosphate/phosphite/phosphonate ABC transporter substrate-binding protein [Candidatus Deferrimicrobium sp.]MDO8738250.1 phosphate/phosphite/phosphonate ABC transporter substrate-binding protein [Candidatus Deferrimicrobium sp.]
MRKWPIAYILFVLCLSLLAACSPQEPPAPAKKPTAKKLLIGLIPEQNIFKQMERYEPLAEYLHRKIGTKIKLKILPRYGNIIDNFKSSGLDGAFFGSFTYTLAHAKVGVEVLARPMALDNTSTYHGLIFVRKDSRIRTARDMKGRRFAFVDKATTAGYLLPLEYFHDHGISDYNDYLKEAYFTGTHEDAVYDVLNRKADIGAAKNTVFQRLAKADPRIMKELVVLARSPDVPENALALRKDIDVSVRDRMKDALLKMHLDPDGKKVLEQFGAQMFIETRNEEYDIIVKYAEDLHLNLSTYDYKND